MLDFRYGKIGILVATSVIEVGVDNPNATMIVIRGADTFGLSQLHQLRGRVGRCEKESLCYFVASGDERMPERLKEVAGSMDGFRLAELDLDRRKIGQRALLQMGMQHGKSELLTDEDLMLLNERPEFTERARAAAKDFMSDGLKIITKYPELERRLAAYRRGETVVD
jgi:ATP-dependent DNA helicase RecG